MNLTDDEFIKAAKCCIQAKTRGECVKLGCPAKEKARAKRKGKRIGMFFNFVHRIKNLFKRGAENGKPEQNH